MHIRWVGGGGDFESREARVREGVALVVNFILNLKALSFSLRGFGGLSHRYGTTAEGMVRPPRTGNFGSAQSPVLRNR